MPNKAKSKVQFRFLEGVAHGTIKEPGLSKEKAKEMLGGQHNYKKLPDKVKKAKKK